VAKEKFKTYYIQPEPATSIIYWSVTFGCFFISLIAMLEQFHITIISLTAFISFLIFLALGLKRQIKLETNTLSLTLSLKRNSRQIAIAEIEKVTVGKVGITFYGSAWNQSHPEETTFLMLPSTKKQFIAKLKSHQDFKGEVIGVKKSVGHE